MMGARTNGAPPALGVHFCYERKSQVLFLLHSVWSGNISAKSVSKTSNSRFIFKKHSIVGLDNGVMRTLLIKKRSLQNALQLYSNLLTSHDVKRLK